MLRSLPQLQKLDNVTVQIDELSEALKKGRILSHPESEQEIEPEPQQYNQQPTYRNSQGYSEQYYQNAEKSPTRQEVSKLSIFLLPILIKTCQNYE